MPSTIRALHDALNGAVTLLGSWAMAVDLASNNRPHHLWTVALLGSEVS